VSSVSNDQLTPVQAAAELLGRRNARTSLDGFAAYMLDVTPAYHHQIICQYIERLLDDEWDELIILAPPGSAKSTYTSVALPPYAMGKAPKPIHVLTASYSTELAEKWGRKIRGLVNGEKYQSVFPHLALSDESKSSGRWATNRGDELYAAGVGSGILGFRADLAIIDDPISGFEQAQSITQLGKVHEWYETDFVTRLKPGAKTVLICQRLARNDLAGYLIDRNVTQQTKRQMILKLPMEAGESDPLGRAPGERLWPDWYTPGMVEDAKRDEFKWKTLYQQEPPADEGSWVGTEDIQFRPSPQITPESSIYGMSDLALSVNSGDYTVHFAVAVDSNGDWDIIEGKRARTDSNQSANDLISLCQTYRPREWLIDDDNASKVFVHLVATRARELGTHVPWKPMPMRGQDKETRAAPLRGQFKRHKVYMPHDAPFTKWLTAELLMFPNALGSGVDDGVDALGLMGRRLMQISRPALTVVAKKWPTTAEMTLSELFDDMPKTGTARI
jgi:predicted phage terminase large subunit-like protein